MATRSFLAAATMAVLLLAGGCASPEYIISTTDGTLMTTKGKPKFDEELGMYVFKDSEGREVRLQKDDVKQIMER